MEDTGAGELLVTSMDRDGTQVGYDIELMAKISSKVNIPVIASGGVGNLDHLVDGIKLGNAFPNLIPSTKWSRLPTPPEAITGIFTLEDILAINSIS